MSDSEATLASPRTAPSPFDSPTTDIILRSSDNVDFNVFSQILVAASPFFATMFELSQPPPPRNQEQPNAKPVVQVSEDSMALEILLRICYPIVPRKVKTLEEVESSLRAAMKFEMELPIVVLTDRLEVLANRFPLQVWAVACRLDLEDVARLAANQLHLSGLERCTPQLLEGVQAGHYYRLHRYLSTLRPKDFQLLVPPSSSSPTTTAESPHSALPSPQTVVEIPTTATDIVCRSSDDVDFHVHRTVLLLSSPVLSQSILASHDGSPIRLEEHSRVLRPLLEFCYPMRPDLESPTIPSDPAEQVSLLVALKKYGIIRGVDAVRGTWQCTARSSPLRAYCVAIRVGDFHSAEVAAEHVLGMDPAEVAYVPEMEAIPAISYHRLLTYCDTCRRVAAEHSREILSSLERLELPRRPDTSPSHGTPVIQRAQAVEPRSLPRNSRLISNHQSWANLNVPIERDRIMTEHSARQAGVDQASKPERVVPQQMGESLPALELAWVLRRAEEIFSEVERRPARTQRSISRTQVATLFTAATRAGPGERVWCARCQVIGEALIMVHEGHNRLDAAIDNVSFEV